MPNSTARTGAAGTYWTAGVLALNGWDASTTPGNTPDDILAQHHERQTLIAVQCKTKSGRGYFLLNKGCEAVSLLGRNEWFVLVALHGAAVPPGLLRDSAQRRGRVRLRLLPQLVERPGQDGRVAKENAMRNVEDEAVRCYGERWDLLEHPTEDTPCWLPDWVFDRAEKTGLPDGHPGITRPDDGVMTAADTSWLPYWIAGASTVSDNGVGPAGSD